MTQNNFPTNWYVKSPIALLDVVLVGVKAIQTIDEDGNVVDNSIRSFLANSDQTVELFSTDGYFLKAFNFTRKGQKEIEAKLAEYGLIEDENFWFLSYTEHLEELKKDEWTKYKEVIDEEITN